MPEFIQTRDYHEDPLLLNMEQISAVSVSSTALVKVEMKNTTVYSLSRTVKFERFARVLAGED